MFYIFFYLNLFLVAFFIVILRKDNLLDIILQSLDMPKNACCLYTNKSSTYLKKLLLTLKNCNIPFKYVNRTQREKKIINFISIVNHSDYQYMTN